MTDEPTDETVIISNVPAPADVHRRACLVVVAGNRVGEVFGIDGSLTVGRGDDVDLRIEDTGMSRRHARLIVDGEQVMVEDLRSTNGTWINGVRIEGRHALADGDKLQFCTSTILRFEYQDETDHAFQRQMFESASRDGLTGALNKRYFLERLEIEVDHAVRHGRSLSLLLMDVDHFKQVNDTHGHLVGDAVLRGVSAVIAPIVRRGDVFARYGGEEFALIMRSAGLETAAGLAEQVRHALAERRFDSDAGVLRVTISIGVASLAVAPEGTPTGLLAAADGSLYRAKRNGRNRVETYRPD